MCASACELRSTAIDRPIERDLQLFCRDPDIVEIERAGAACRNPSAHPQIRARQVRQRGVGYRSNPRIEVCAKPPA